MSTFKRDGTVNVDVFSDIISHTYANGLSISDIINNEIAIYNYHYRRHYRTDN